jgi:hypothetical protein
MPDINKWVGTPSRRAPDTVNLVKPNGDRIEDIAANVQPSMIFIWDGSLPIEEGDKITRVLPNGLPESYLVLDRGFYAKRGSFPDHYQIKVRKESSIAVSREQAQPRASAPSITIHGDVHGMAVTSTGPAIGQMTTDRGNVSIEELSALLTKLGEAIDQSDAPEQAKAAAKINTAQAALEMQKGEEYSNPDVVKTAVEAIPTIVKNTPAVLDIIDRIRHMFG